MPAIRRCLVVLLTALVAAPATAAAQRPANDARTSPQDVGNLPAVVHGTTAGATREAADPASPCGCDGASLWYRYTASTDGRVALTLEARDDLDAVVDVFLQQRSRLLPVDSDLTDAQGRAGIGFPVRQGRAYVVRVAQRFGSAPGRFVLTLSATAPTVRGPGRALPDAGVTDVLDRVLRPSVVFNTPLREGTTYRFSMVPRQQPVPATDPPGEEEGEDEDDEIPPCLARLLVYPPGTRSFADAEPVFSLPCDGYRLFTPARAETGRYVLRVLVPRGARGPQRWHLQVARADVTDTAPGRFLGNHARVRAGLRGSGVDRVDLYRFALAERSMLKLEVTAGDDLRLTLRNDRGRLVEASDGEIRRRLRPGRYFVAVTAPPGVDTRYTLTRSSRSITRSGISISGQTRARGRLGQALTVAMRVRPTAGGPARITIQRFDPEAGWQYFRTERPRVRGGVATFSFAPPTVGRWRVRGEFLGTRDAAASETGFAQVLVVSARG